MELQFWGKLSIASMRLLSGQLLPGELSSIYESNNIISIREELVKLATIVEGNQKALFNRCRGGLLLSLDCSTILLIRTLYCGVLNKEVPVV